MDSRKKVEFIEQKRLQYNWTKKQMADFLGVSHVTYFYWEKGRAHPSLRQIKILIFFARIRRFLEIEKPEYIRKMNEIENEDTSALVEAFVLFHEQFKEKKDVAKN